MEKHYLAKEGREITIEEIAKELKVTKEDIALAMESVAPVESIEKNIFGDEENKLSLIDKISTGKNEEEIITNKIVVKELINKLDKKEKEVIMLRFYKEKTQSQVAKILGITQVQVSRNRKKNFKFYELKLISIKINV